MDYAGPELGSDAFPLSTYKYIKIPIVIKTDEKKNILLQLKEPDEVSQLQVSPLAFTSISDAFLPWKDIFGIT